jgi:hypothetical protein
MTAAIRKTPTTLNGGSDNGTTYTQLVDNEVEALWKCQATYLVSVAGTNAITASSDTTLVAAITAYARPMAFWLDPALANTGAVTINIDAVGIINVKDQFGAALQGGELQSTGLYLLVFDGTNFRAVGVTAGAANRPTTAPDVIANETQASGVNGNASGNFVTGAYRQRTLNTLVRNNIGASLASNQITLPAGTYFAEWSAPAYQVGIHKTRLQNITDATTIALGTAESAQNSSTSRSVGSVYFTIATSKVIEIEHRANNTQNTNGFGPAATFGDNEIFAEIRIWKQ